MDTRQQIVSRVAQELEDGMVVNLGIGMPTMVVDHLPPDVKIILQSENGILGMGPAPEEGASDGNIVNAGGQPVTVYPGAQFFDSATSFAIIRGGHVDLTVLGALQVDARGSLASHIIPGKMVPGMGGAMDLVTGSQKVIVCTTHTTKNGDAKILEEISLPATAVASVDMIITELAVMEVVEEGLLLTEIAQGYTVEQVQNLTGATLLISQDLQEF